MKPIVWDFEPELFRIGNYGPRYYGLMFALGFLIGYYIMQYVFRRENRNEEDLSSLLLHIMLGTVIGARLGHCFFYEPFYYLQHPLEIFAVWSGGLASHGGTIGVLIALVLYIRKHPDQPFRWLGSRLVAPVALTACFIRLGNFFNSEIIGLPTHLPWGVVFQRATGYGAPVARHPSMLYESLTYLVIFAILMVRYVKYGPKINPDVQIGIMFTGIFGARILIEMTKENQVLFENGMPMNMGQLLSIPFVLIGLTMIFGWHRKLLPEGWLGWDGVSKREGPSVPKRSSAGVAKKGTTQKIKKPRRT